MSPLLKLRKNFGAARFPIEYSGEISLCLRRNSTEAPAEAQERETDKEGFRIFKLFPPKTRAVSKTEKPLRVIPKLEERYRDAADWTNIWVGPKSFLPSVVPLPVRQGYREKGEPCSKYANAELMKIPNFLHLTPPAIKKHCNALKQFCTKWPENLNKDNIDTLFPVTVVTSDYCHSSPTIRDPLSRIVTLQVKLSSLQLNKHAKDKMLRLLGPRYDHKTDLITLTAENCPLKKQNYDYAMYILTALYFESWKVEDWEKTKSFDDMEKYDFGKSNQKKVLESHFKYNNRHVPDMENLGKAMSDYINKGETLERINCFKKEMMNTLGLASFEEAQ